LLALYFFSIEQGFLMELLSKSLFLKEKGQQPALVLAAAVGFAKVATLLHPVHLFVVSLFSFWFFFDSIFLFLAVALLVFLKPHPNFFFENIPFFLWMKALVKRTIFSLYSEDVAHFFNTFFLGEECSYALGHTFRALGLSHLLAISGFHFQTLLSTIDFFIQPWSKKKSGIYILFFVAVTYVFMIEVSASVLRSFISISISLIAPLVGRISDAKNSFYLSYFLIFLFFPQKIDTTGCVLSFLATFGILFYKKTVENFLKNLFISPSVYFFEKKKSQLKKTFLSIFSLNLAVFITTTPYILLKLEAYPPISLLTNLFFSTLMVPAFFLFLVSLFCPFMSGLVNLYVQKILMLMQAVPRPLAFNVSVPTEFFFFLETILILTILIPIIRPCFKTSNPV